MYFVYIVRCQDNTYYIGSTPDLKRRIKEHNTSKNGAHYTKIRRPVVLVYKEMYSTQKEALQREAALKRLKRTEKEKLIRRSEESTV